MNLVQMIMDLLAGGGLGKLSSLLGESEAKTKTAVSAAVPALLSGLSSVASTGDGAQRIMSALGKVDQGSLGNIGGMLSGLTEGSADQGSSMLGSILGGSAVSGIAGAIAKYSGLGSGVVSKLLGYLSPLIMGMLAKQLVGKMTPQGLTGLLGGQKANIASAIPAGFSLDSIPGLGTAKSVAQSAYNTATNVPTPGLPKWVIPAVGLAALAAILWWLFGMRTSVPDVAQVTKDLTGTFTTLADTVGGIKDAASATAAIPKLAELTTKLDGMKAIMDKLPAEGRAKIADFIKSNVGKMSDQLGSALMIPGVGDKLRPALEGVVSKVSSLGGLSASQFALPSVEVTKLGSDLTSMFGTLTQSLTGIKDAASAETALPKLKEIEGRLDTSMGTWNNLPAAGKASIGSLVKTALAKLKPLLDKVLALAGVGDKVKPVIDPIMTKLNNFIG